MQQSLSQGLTWFITCRDTTECDVIVPNALNCLEIRKECGAPPRAEGIGPGPYRVVTRCCVSATTDSYPSPFRNLLTASDQPVIFSALSVSFLLGKGGVNIGLSS